MFLYGSFLASIQAWIMLLFEVHEMINWGVCFGMEMICKYLQWQPQSLAAPHGCVCVSSHCNTWCSGFLRLFPELTAAGRRQFCLCFCLLNSPPLSGFQIVNITMAALQYQEQQSGRKPVDITFTVHGFRGYLMGSEVSNALMRLTVVEFSYYMGFPVLQIAEREYNKRNCYWISASFWLW